MLKSKMGLAVWICNAVVAVMSLFAIISYFFMPFWSINISYTVDEQMVRDMIGDSVEFDTSSIVGEDGIELEVSLSFETSVLFKSFGDESDAVGALIDDNVDSLVDQLSDTLSTVAEKAVRAFASGIVSQEIHSNIKNILSAIDPSITDEEVSQRLNAIGITDDYISSKTNAIIDRLYSDGSTVDGVCDEVVDAIDEIYTKIVGGDDADLRQSEFTDEQKDAIRQSVKDTMGNLAAEDGTIDADEIIASIFLSAIESVTGSDSDSSDNYAAAPPKTVGENQDEANAAGETEESAVARLKQTLHNFILDRIPEDVTTVIVWVMRGMMFMFFFSSFWWLYILIKLTVKLMRIMSPAVKKNPTVKLKAPIWFGWLPFFILVVLPSIAFGVLKNSIGGISEEIASLMNAASISFSSAGLIAAVMALVCFGISIFYMHARKHLKAVGASEGASSGGAKNDLAADSKAEAAASDDAGNK